MANQFEQDGQQESDVSKNNSQNSGAFQAPRHWVGIDELNPNYWTDSDTQTRRSQEFFDKPIETLEAIEKMDKEGLARREFLTIMGASMALAGTACVRRPVRKIIPYVIKPEEITPGVSLHYATTAMVGTTAVGLLVKTREGRPVKLEGNPEYPTNRGKLSARQQAALLSLYDMDRLTEPTRVKRGDGPTQKITWEVVDQEIAEALSKAKVGGKKVRLVLGTRRGPASQAILREFFGGFGDAQAIEFFPHHFDDLSSTYGEPCQLEYQLEDAKVVASIGGDFLGTFGDPVQQAMDWSKGRKLTNQKDANSANMSKLWVFESQLSVTGSNADFRVGIRPGDELKIAMALVHALRSKGLSINAANISSYSPKAVGELVGKSESNSGGAEGISEKIEKLASDLMNARGKSAVIAGGLITQTEDAAILQSVVAAINSSLGNQGQTVIPRPLYPSGSFVQKSSYSAIRKLVQEMNSGDVGVLIFVGVNPVYHLPTSYGWTEAVSKVGTVIGLVDRIDESAVHSDFALPLQHFLESWGDAISLSGVVSIQQPALSPLHASRSFEENLIAWAKVGKLGVGGLLNKALAGSLMTENTPQPIVGPAAGAAATIEASPWYDYLAAYWQSSFFPNYGNGKTFQKFWEDSLSLGFISETLRNGKSISGYRTSSLDQIPSLKAHEGGFRLGVYESVSMGDGSEANNAWLQELPDPVSTITWDNYVNLSPATAKKLKVQQDEVVNVSGDGIQFELPVNIQPGLHSEAVTVAAGYGRQRAGKIGNKVGFNTYTLGKAGETAPTLSGFSVNIRKTGKFYRLAATQWHHTSESRPILNDISLMEYKADPKTANHTDPHLRIATPTMWTKHTYPGHRWGMTIDLTSCIGCAACVVACQAENNIPIVGRDNVRRSREMHWIRIDRYYSGEADQPEVIFQPMLCQHCENAPCETVCPVLATVHSTEGLNDMSYNRCVGTRYCQNNCPYKVRRFNFFDHWKQYQGTLNMVWNPDVTVRMRGVMEKCTFCIQRIQEAKGKAKDAGKRVQDGEIKTACQQTCPTDAIVFGDINDANSQVSKLFKRPEGFKSLEVLNVQPSITYLSKVRNREAKDHGHSGASEKSTEHHS